MASGDRAQRRGRPAQAQGGGVYAGASSGDVICLHRRAGENLRSRGCRSSHSSPRTSWRGPAPAPASAVIVPPSWRQFRGGWRPRARPRGREAGLTAREGAGASSGLIDRPAEAGRLAMLIGVETRRGALPFSMRVISNRIVAVSWRAELVRWLRNSRTSGGAASSA